MTIKNATLPGFVRVIVLCILAALIASAVGASSVANAATRARTKLFRGAWFEVRYPSSFRARPGMGSNAGQGIDSAFFRSADGAAEFYVFSPLWNGNPSDSALRRSEVLVSRRIETRRDRELVYYTPQRDRNGRTVQVPRPESVEKVRVVWTTARARNGSYTRSWLDVTHPDLNTRYVFGFQYRNQAAYRRYLPAYNAFKRSLGQWSD